MVFLPPRGVKIRSVWESVAFPAEPSLLAPRDEGRFVVILYVGLVSGEYPIIARTRNGVSSQAALQDYAGPLEVYGPEEIWVAQASNSDTLVPASFTYQALYWA